MATKLMRVKFIETCQLIKRPQKNQHKMSAEDLNSNSKRRTWYWTSACQYWWSICVSQLISEHQNFKQSYQIPYNI